MASFSSLALTILEICAFEVQKTEHFFKENSPLMKFQKVGTKSLIPEFSKLGFK